MPSRPRRRYASFFGSSQLSQFMDQTNPLSEITHKRRLSALGPATDARARRLRGARRAPDALRPHLPDSRPPEGPNIGLINSLATFRPRQQIRLHREPLPPGEEGRVTEEVNVPLGDGGIENTRSPQANAELDGKGKFTQDLITCRHAGDVIMVPADKVDLMDVSPKQVISVAAALIPFLENDDANRALMGSNMQRQAVPLVKAEAPLVGHRMEPIVARDSAPQSAPGRTGVVDQVDATASSSVRPKRSTPPSRGSTSTG